jgi:hypothetical protein
MRRLPRELGLCAVASAKAHEGDFVARARFPDTVLFIGGFVHIDATLGEHFAIRYRAFFLYGRMVDAVDNFLS